MFCHHIGPYQPPEPFQGRRSAWYAGDFPVSAAALNRSARAVGRRPSSEDIRYVRSRYDENVEFADHLVGRVVRMLREAGRYDDALVMLTSDHGEGFFEHGRFLHTRLLYDEFLRIPLIVKWPVTATGFAAEVDVDVSLVDLAPTIVDGLGLSQDLAGFQAGPSCRPRLTASCSPGRCSRRHAVSQRPTQSHGPVARS